MAVDNKPIKYIRCANGEIVLVVIGILISLSINNWNENRKRKNEELFLLVGIKKNLETMLIDFTVATISNSNDIIQYAEIEHEVALRKG